jgi:hypothetical protein
VSDEKNLVSPGASSAERPSPTKGAAAGCDESVRVGSTVWRYAERHYRPDGFNFEESFFPIAITSETRVSWIAKEGWREFKFPKKKPADEWHKDPDSRLAKSPGGGTTRVFLARRAVDDEVWGFKNGPAIRKIVEALLSSAQRGGVAELRRIAALVGYRDPVPSQPAAETSNAPVTHGDESPAKSEASSSVASPASIVGGP